MNFNSTFEELSKLYESVPTEEPLIEGKIIDGIKKVGTRLGADVATIVRCFAEISGSEAFFDLATHVENKVVLKALQSGNETVLNTLTKEDIEELKQDIEDYEKAKKADETESIEEDIETEDAEEVDIEIEEDEQEEDEQVDAEAGAKVVLECSKCGGILLKDGADISPDEENPALVNVGEPCRYCEAEEGFGVLGDFIPVESEADLEEGIFGLGKKKKSSAGNADKANTAPIPRTVNFRVFDQNGVVQFNNTYKETGERGLMNAEDQFKTDFKNSSAYKLFQQNSPTDWQYTRVSTPVDTEFDTDYRDRPARNHFIARDFHL